MFKDIFWGTVIEFSIDIKQISVVHICLFIEKLSGFKGLTRTKLIQWNFLSMSMQIYLKSNQDDDWMNLRIGDIHIKRVSDRQCES